MRELKFIFIMAILLISTSCGTGRSEEQVSEQKVAQKQLDDFENQLTAEGFFWQSESGSKVDFLFIKNGDAIVLTDGRLDSESNGKWSFDKSDGQLQVALNGGKQYAPKIVSISDDWKTIVLSSRIHEYGSNKINKMKLLDNRFNQ